MEVVLIRGAITTDSAERIGMRPVMKDARPAVQSAWPYQLVNMGCAMPAPVTNARNLSVS